MTGLLAKLSRVVPVAGGGMKVSIVEMMTVVRRGLNELR